MDRKLSRFAAKVTFGQVERLVAEGMPGSPYAARMALSDYPATR